MVHRLKGAGGSAELTTPAIVMALGIFVNGSLPELPIDAPWLGASLTLLLIAVTLVIAVQVGRALSCGAVERRTLRDPVEGFGAGTWVAASVECAAASARNLSGVPALALLFTLAAALLWLRFVGPRLKDFPLLFHGANRARLHGGVLLATVSTQALVVAGSWTIPRGPVLRAADLLLICAGAGCYFACLAALLLRYLPRFRLLDLDRDWYNTNCIMHGAMSITGLAAALSGALPRELILLIWLWAAAWFIIVEAIEVARLVVRLRRHGAGQALARYSLSQWSRNFTFGMFVAFTVHLHPGSHAGASALLRAARGAVAGVGPWVVLALLVYELALLLTGRPAPAPSARSS